MLLWRGSFPSPWVLKAAWGWPSCWQYSQALRTVGFVQTLAPERFLLVHHKITQHIWGRFLWLVPVGKSSQKLLRLFWFPGLSPSHPAYKLQMFLSFYHFNFWIQLMHVLGTSCCWLLWKDQSVPELLSRWDCSLLVCFQPAPMASMDKIACCPAAVAAPLCVTTSPGSARVPLAGLAMTANTVSQTRVCSPCHTLSPRDLSATVRTSSVCS